MGFATLPNQVHRKSVKKGFDFTLMVAGEPCFVHNSRQSAVLHVTYFSFCSFTSKGESGLGKSTLVNSLFLTDLYKDRKLLNAEGIEASFIFGSVTPNCGAVGHKSTSAGRSIFTEANAKLKPETMSNLSPLPRANHSNSRNHQTHGGYRGERCQTQAHYRGHAWIWGCCQQH